MKLKRFNEEFRIVNKSDLEGRWVPPAKEKKKKPHREVNFNRERGKKVYELLHEYDLCIIDISESEWCSKYASLLPDEKDLVEYRVEYGMLVDKNNFYEDEPEYERRQNFDWSDFDIEKDRDLIRDDIIQHSVFLPVNWKLSGDDLIYAALDWATDYLHKLTNYPSVIEGDTELHKLYNNPKQFVAWLNSHDIKFTNENLADLPDIDYRLYKDSKFFAQLESETEIRIEKLFRDWLAIK